MFGRKPQPQPQPPMRRPSAYVRSEVSAPPTLHPAQVQRIDWEKEAAAEARQLAVRPARPVAYVPNLAEALRIQAPHLGSPDAHLVADITAPSVVEAKTIGSHQDRARAWLKYAMPLSLTLAGVSVIAAVAYQAVPLLSFWTLLIFGLTFALCYSVLLREYWRRTPEGVALENVQGLWGHYRREQAHRQAIERAIVDAQMDTYQRRIGGGK
jgi:hypothetical protein